jgi:hypothetical protein
MLKVVEEEWSPWGSARVYAVDDGERVGLN